MTAAELRGVVEATRNLTRWDSSVPMVRMIDTMFKHADVLVELVAVCERVLGPSQPTFDGSLELELALTAVHAIDKETT